MDEAALINAAQTGDLDSFNHLVLIYQDQVYTQAYRMINDNAAAADATQEAFISAYHHIHSYRGGSFRALLLRIVTNACYDEMRRRKRRPTVALEPVDEDGEEIDPPRWMIVPGDSPETRVDRLELQNAIKHCLEELPDDFRLAVVLVDVQGMDYGEASQAMGKPLGPIKSRLARARLRLRDCLQGFMELLPSAYRLGNG